MAGSEAEKRRERLAAALRENLKRRKAQKQGASRPPQDAAPAVSDRPREPLSPHKSPR